MHGSAWQMGCGGGCGVMMIVGGAGVGSDGPVADAGVAASAVTAIATAITAAVEPVSVSRLRMRAFIDVPPGSIAPGASMTSAD